YPNPVRSSLKISYVLYEPSNVEIDLYNVKGQFIDRILNDNYLIGKHSINRDIINYPSGLYYIHYKTDKQAETKKITIIR
nr:T9SS type A sorting domain-containing protein [Candidatus Cloacimonadota bacterium]